MGGGVAVMGELERAVDVGQRAELHRGRLLHRGELLQQRREVVVAGAAIVRALELVDRALHRRGSTDPASGGLGADGVVVVGEYGDPIGSASCRDRVCEYV